TEIENLDASAGSPTLASVTITEDPGGRTRQSDRDTPTESSSHSSACCAQSLMSVRLRKPSRRRSRASRGRSAETPSGRLVPSALPFRLSACPRAAPGRNRPVDSCASCELSAEGGIFCDDFLIPLAFDRRLRHRRNLPHGLRVFQIGVDRRHYHAGLDGDEI